jgi:methyl-accepting chemotaxis protein
MNLSQRFLVPTLAVMAVSMGVLTWVSYTTGKSSLKQSAISYMDYVSASSAAKVESWVQERQIELGSWAAEKTIQEAARAKSDSTQSAASAELARLAQHFKTYERLNLVGPDGIYTASTDPTLVGKLSIADRPYFKTAMAGQPAVSMLSFDLSLKMLTEFNPTLLSSFILFVSLVTSL